MRPKEFIVLMPVGIDGRIKRIEICPMGDWATSGKRLKCTHENLSIYVDDKDGEEISQIITLVINHS